MPTRTSARVTISAGLALFACAVLLHCGSASRGSPGVDGGGDGSAGDDANAPSEASVDASPDTLVEASVDASPDTLEASDTGPDCGYAEAGNEVGCPSTYSAAQARQSCSPAGLACSYPGQGDGIPGIPGCFSTAGMVCTPADAGLGGGPLEAGSPYWLVVQ